MNLIMNIQEWSTHIQKWIMSIKKWIMNIQVIYEYS